MSLKRLKTDTIWELCLIQAKHLDIDDRVSLPEGAPRMNYVKATKMTRISYNNQRKSALLGVKDWHRSVSSGHQLMAAVATEVKEKLGLDYASLFLSEAKMVKLVLEQGNILDRSTYDVIQDIITDMASKYDADTLAKLEVISAEFEKNYAE